MSENVFVGADSFRRLLLGAAGGYELQGHHEAAETVLHVIDALDELTTGGKGRSQADEDQEAMNRYIKKKTRARSVAKAEADPFAELEGWESLEQIQEAYGYGEIIRPPGQVDGPVGGQRGRTAQGKERWQISRPCNRYAGPCYSQRGH